MNERDELLSIVAALLFIHLERVREEADLTSDQFWPLIREAVRLWLKDGREGPPATRGTT